ncbi:MAG: MFS transporter [Candidatus Bathyarchaeia archaeon]
MELGADGHRREIMAILFAAHGVHHAYLTLTPLLFPIIRAEFGLSYAQLGIMLTGFLYAYAALQAPASLLLKFVERRFILGIGMALMAFATMLMGLSASFEALLLCQMLAGIGASTYHPMATSLVSKLSREGRGRAIGIHLSGGNLGTSLGPLIGGFLVAAVGWRWGLMLSAIPGLILGLLIASFKGLGGSPAGEGGARRGIAEILRNRAVILITATSALTLFRFRGISSFAPSYFVEAYGLDVAKAGILASIMFAAGFFSPPLLGHISDRLGRRAIVALISAISALSISLMAARLDAALTIANLIVVGFTIYSSSSPIQALLAEVVAPELMDLCFGVFFTLDFLAGNVAPLLLGFVIDAWGFEPAFHTIAILTALSALTILPIREPPRRMG